MISGMGNTWTPTKAHEYSVTHGGIQWDIVGYLVGYLVGYNSIESHSPLSNPMDPTKVNHILRVPTWR